MIPRKVHVVWVGPTDMPQRETLFLEKNKSRLPKYEFVLWDNQKISELKTFHGGVFNIVKFILYCESHSRWAFLSDLIKLHALYEHGGWAIDADNEFLTAPEKYRKYNWVSGFENWNGHLSPITAVWGAVKKHKFTKLLFGFYMQKDPQFICSVENTRWISTILLSHGITGHNQEQYSRSLDVRIFPDHIFCGPEITSETTALHHFAASWKR
jgi:hypothetical protein